jgi:hypothetical protein
MRVQIQDMDSESVYDLKQQRLIQSWIDFADRQNVDAYSQFIALWIAFNAACYGRYFKAANCRRANLSKGKGLEKVPSEPTPIHGTIVRENDRFKLKVSEPGRIVITITDRYTEDTIFNEFAREFKEEYRLALGDEKFRLALDQLRDSLRKNDRFYVINMARAAEHDLSQDFNDMKAKNVIVPFDSSKLRQVKMVLYQIRCNIFHGEKVPGELNDDRIVKCAIPVLRRLLNFLFPGRSGCVFTSAGKNSRRS